MTDTERNVERIRAAIEETCAAASTKKGRVQRACLANLAAHRVDDALPTNGRFVFYELEQEGFAHKLPQGRRRASRAHGEAGIVAAQDVTDALIFLREQGLVSWDWLVDETRRLHEWEHAATIAEYVADGLDLARINPWDGEPPVILGESRTLGVLRNLVAEYVVPLAPTAGMANGFLVTKVAPLFEDDPDRPVLYIGDLEDGGPGEAIEENTRRVLERATGTELWNWERIAITAEQVGDIEPIEKLDTRNRPPKPYLAWEVESRGQRWLMDTVRDALDELLPEPLDDVQEREEAQRKAVRTKLNGDAD